MKQIGQIVSRSLTDQAFYCIFQQVLHLLEILCSICHEHQKYNLTRLISIESQPKKIVVVVVAIIGVVVVVNVVVVVIPVVDPRNIPLK